MGFNLFYQFIVTKRDSLLFRTGEKEMKPKDVKVQCLIVSNWTEGVSTVRIFESYVCSLSACMAIIRPKL